MEFVFPYLLPIRNTLKIKLCDGFVMGIAMGREPQTIQEWFLILTHFNLKKLQPHSIKIQQIKEKAATQTVTDRAKAVATQEHPGSSAGT